MTHSKMKVLPQALLAALIVTPMAFAQTPTPVPQKVEKIEVTGSNIKRVDAETTSPITIITAEDIKRSGATSVQELLNNLSIAQGGSLNDISGGNGFSPGSATIALRGLGSQSTLTLLNGRRISPAAFNDPNTGNSVITNLNSIPATAIERIEVLKDGASAVYGSDAIAGVVNIILRKDFTGALVGATVTQNFDSEFQTRQVNVALGFGDLARNKYNVFVNYERFERDPVRIRDNDNVDDRWAFTGTNPPGLNRGTVFTGFSFPGNLLRESVPGSNIFNVVALARPGCAIVVSGQCRYNQWNDREQSGKTIRDTTYARGSYDITANLSAFGEVSHSKATNTFTSEPFATNIVSNWLSSSGQPLRFVLALPVGHPDNPFAFRAGIAYRFVEFGLSQDISKTEDTRTLVGLKGTAGRWDWESGFLYNTSKQTSSSGRRLLFPEVQNAINDGSLRFNGTMDQAMVNRISTRYTNEGKSTTKIWDLKGSSEWGSLPGGPIGVAAGAEFRKDELVITPDANIVASRIVGLGASFANGSRNVSAVFLEAVLPISKTVEGTLAARYDRYSDYGSSTNPRVGIKWKALPSLAMRANYSTGFRAPTLSQISTSAIRSFQSIASDPLRCPVTGADADCRTFGVASQIQFNPNLQPEKSKSATAGFIWDVTKDTGVTMDYFKIRRNNEIDRFSSTFVLAGQFRGEARFANAVIRDPNPLSWLPGVQNSGPIQTVLRQYLNLGGSEVSGVDLNIIHRLNLGEMGKMTLALDSTYNISRKFAREQSDPLTDSIGGVNRPRVRGNFSAVWEYRDWTFGARYNYVGKYSYRDGFGTCEDYLGATAIANLPGVCEVRSWQTIDANVAYSGFKNLVVRLVIRNIQDNKPPFDYNADTTLGYNTNYHNPQGINGALNATYTFK